MIELSLTELSVAVLAATMLWIFALAGSAGYREARERRRAAKDRRICRLCLAVFESGSRDAVQDCPECGAKTGAKGPRPLA
jgi:hypothetical protein